MSFSPARGGDYSAPQISWLDLSATSRREKETEKEKEGNCFRLVDVQTSNFCTLRNDAALTRDIIHTRSY